MNWFITITIIIIITVIDSLSLAFHYCNRYHYHYVITIIGTTLIIIMIPNFMDLLALKRHAAFVTFFISFQQDFQCLVANGRKAHKCWSCISHCSLRCEIKMCHDWQLVVSSMDIHCNAKKSLLKISENIFNVSQKETIIICVAILCLPEAQSWSKIT